MRPERESLGIQFQAYNVAYQCNLRNRRMLGWRVMYPSLLKQQGDGRHADFMGRVMLYAKFLLPMLEVGC